MADGGSQNDPAHPNFVWAPSPSDASRHVLLFANPFEMRRLIEDRRGAPIGQFLGLVHGKLPPIEGVDPPDTTDNLMNTVAVFKGIMRPRIDFGRDTEIHVYITNPPVNFVYPATVRDRADGLAQVPVPDDSVFATYVEFGQAAVEGAQDAIDREGGGRVDGIIHTWEWVLGDPNNPRLPDEHDARYLERVW